MENTFGTQNEIIGIVNNNLKQQRLSKSWAADQIGVSNEYLRAVLSLNKYLTNPMREKLIKFNEKLETINRILAS